MNFEHWKIKRELEEQTGCFERGTSGTSTLCLFLFSLMIVVTVVLFFSV
jgi:hypothetical protein